MSSQIRRVLSTLVVVLLALGGVGLTTPPAQAVSGGTAVGWGYNDYGQTTVPAALDGKSVTAIEAGYHHSLALTAEGKVVAWGYNDFGATSIPAALNDTTVTGISAGAQHSLAVTSEGKVIAWGANWLGEGSVPAALNDKTVTAISAGDALSLALTSEGKVIAWGYNGSGQTSVPAALDDKTVTAISAGESYVLALTSEGKVIAWGTNTSGQTSIPAALDDKTVTAISAGTSHSLALTSEGKVIAWGAGWAGQASPPAELDEKTVIAIAAGFDNSLAVTSDGSVAGWGSNANGKSVAPPASSGMHYTAVSGGANHSLALVAPAASDFAPAVTATITGTPKVGQVLTADAGDVAPAPDSYSYRWFADTAEIAAANSATFTPTGAEFGKAISVEVSAVKAGYTSSTDTSPATDPVGGGVITLPTPTITGSPVVDGTLGAELPDGLDPADADVSFEWFRGATSLGTGNTYSPTAADVDAVLTVAATATKDFYDNTSQSVQSAPVTRATFGTAPDATISGTLKVGQTLTAGGGTIAPDPDSLDYQWYADGNPIADATAVTFTLTPAQKHAEITVEVTARRAGYQNASDLSASSAEVATDLAPDLRLDAADPTLRRGESTTLTWTSVEADSVTASGAWRGTKDAAGSMAVSPNTLGKTTYVLMASNANGTTTTQVTISVTRPAKALLVTAARGLHLARTNLAVTTRGLEAGEQYAVLIGGVQVATGTASTSAALTRRVPIPARPQDGSATITVTGSESDRRGATTTPVVVNKTLGLRLGARPARVRHLQRVRVTGLASREKVTVTYRGRRVSPASARADHRGRYKVAFHVGKRPGARIAKATGQFPGRTASTTFRVTRN